MFLINTKQIIKFSFTCKYKKRVLYCSSRVFYSRNPLVFSILGEVGYGRGNSSSADPITVRALIGCCCGCCCLLLLLLLMFAATVLTCCC